VVGPHVGANAHRSAARAVETLKVPLAMTRAGTTWVML